MAAEFRLTARARRSTLDRLPGRPAFDELDAHGRERVGRGANVKVVHHSLVFDGTSFAMDADGRLLACAPSFREDLTFVDFDNRQGDQRQNLPDECEAA